MRKPKTMQGIEPKFHSSLTDRMDYYRVLLKKNAVDSDIQPSDMISRISELGKLYEDYLANKKQLEKSIKNYRQYHNDLRKQLTLRVRELRRKTRQK
ncbi:hypothetical protein EG346_21470 [Chryseobacterium carnipullorum]|uniref:Uncharacterized protein n=2 Tax=Chryseobacterium carnipullorum TaxID=1124835 RepID=A0A3G6NHY1_CHRCU|nr:hypothetical protein [Chryseobacterium carnipullorum]AZA50589.1 hypothetical protein EG346_21470 [Chryseobacterium carnipullorum]AZA65455.1 hypothetical protein EG345_12550 [Chryseobacterium carnipullorum]